MGHDLDPDRHENQIEYWTRRAADPQHCTVQTVDLILPRIGRIPQLHFCIEKKFMPNQLCCVVRYFTLA